MAFFAPSIASPQQRRVGSSWGWFGSPTRSGVRVNRDVALTLSAVWAATRVLSETIAALPIGMVETLGPKNRQPRPDHEMSRLIANRPCPGWDSMAWFDYQVAHQVNGGNAFAEKQRDLNGRVTALWPIHPVRIPPENITIASDDQYYAIYGIAPGEIVYNVRNDDGGCTPIPARDMLHVPGRGAEAKRTPAGVPYGVGVPDQMVAAESLGTALATERSAGSFFANGMGSRFVLKHPSRIKEQKEELRRQWQETYGGPNNTGKTIILEDGMDLSLVSVSPEAAQMIASREFNVREIARWYRLPPHMIGDLGRATWANIDAQQLSFVTDSLLPWLVRWEEALRLQLLPESEWARLAFKFNVNGLLRGDYAARSAFYKEMVNIGVFSPNDVRSLEDMNEIEGGDRYFIQGNNLVPLDRIDDLVTAKMKQGVKPTEGETDRAERLARLRGAMTEDIEAVDLGEIIAGAAQAITAISTGLSETNAMVRSLLNEDGERAVSLHEVSIEAEESFSGLKASWDELRTAFGVARETISGTVGTVEQRAAELARKQAEHDAKESAFRSRQRKAVRGILQGALTGVAAIEVRAVRQAAKDYRSFGDVVEKFYTGKLPDVWNAAFSPLSDVLAAAAIEWDMATELASHVEASRSSIDGWDSVGSQELAGWISERVESWSGRPALAAARLVPEEQG